MVCVALFVVIVVGMFTFAYLKKQEMNVVPEVKNDESQEQIPYASVTEINAKHFFADGVHTLVGEIPFPTPCDLLQTDARVAESFPEQVTLIFSVLNNAEMCAQTVTAQRFKIEASASEQATFTAQFMGRPVTLNLIPPAAGETPEEFELFIKG